MKLESEEREVGVENFYAAVGNKLTRAKVLEQTVEEGLATKKGLGSQYFKYGKPDRPVRVGVIGTGDEGSVLIGAINPEYVQVVAIADIRPYNVYRAFHGDKSSANTRVVRPGLIKLYGWPDEATAREKVKVYTDGYEDLLDDDNVEAVIIALPLHLHAEASIKAMRKGKHVLCEKLMAHSVAQCKEMARVAEAEDRLLAIGHQRHYSVLYDNAVELVKKGVIGQIHHIRAQWHRKNDSWMQPMPTDQNMKDDLAEAEKNLSAAKENYAKVKQEAKKKVTNEKHLKDLAKFDGELESRPKKVAELKAQLAELAKQDDADEKQKQEIVDEIKAQEARLAAVNKRYLQILRLDPRKYNMTALAEKVELLTHRLKDAELATKVKDYGYVDREVGGRKVPALEELIRWRLWDRTGGGLMAELGSHQLDAAGIFISSLRDDGKKVHPLSVTGVGGRHIYEHDRDIDDHVYCSFEYPAPEYDKDKAPEKRIVVSYSSINGNGFGGYGETVLGTTGTLLLDKEQDVLLYYKSSTSKYTRVTGKGDTLKLADGKQNTSESRLAREALKGPISRGYTEEIEHWAWVIREKDEMNQVAANDKGEATAEGEAEEDSGSDSSPEASKKISVPLRCSPKVALADAVIALTTNIAIKRGQKGENCRIQFEEAWFDPASDETPEGEKPNVDRPEYKI